MTLPKWKTLLTALVVVGILVLFAASTMARWGEYNVSGEDTTPMAASSTGATDEEGKVAEPIQVIHPFLGEMGMYASAARMVPTALRWEDHDVQQVNDEFFGNMSNYSAQELRRELPTEEDVSRTAQAFMAEHGLFDEIPWVSGPPEVLVGGTWQGEGDPVAMDWIAEWRDPELADLGSDVHVRVGASGDVYRLDWDVREVGVQEGRIVRLRPLSEVLADPKAWHEGEITGDLPQLAGNTEGPPLDLRNG